MKIPDGYAKQLGRARKNNPAERNKTESDRESDNTLKRGAEDNTLKL